MSTKQMNFEFDSDEQGFSWISSREEFLKSEGKGQTGNEIFNCFYILL